MDILGGGWVTLLAFSQSSVPLALPYFLLSSPSLRRRNKV
jgi:hypothetical protein